MPRQRAGGVVGRAANRGRLQYCFGAAGMELLDQPSRGVGTGGVATSARNCWGSSFVSGHQGKTPAVRIFPSGYWRKEGFRGMDFRSPAVPMSLTHAARNASHQGRAGRPDRP